METKNSNGITNRLFAGVIVCLVVCGGFGELLVYDGFEYDSSPLANQNGGFGWKGSWHYYISPPNLAGSSTFSLNTNESLSSENLPFVPKGGCIWVPEGDGGRACRFLGDDAVIDLNKDGVYYISYLFRRNDIVISGSNEWTFFRLLYMGQSYSQELITISTTSNRAWQIDNLGYSVQTSPGAFELNTTYFVVIKIVTKRYWDNADCTSVFLKVYPPDGQIDVVDDDIKWTLVNQTNNHSFLTVDFIEMGGGIATGYAFDEIRLATKWTGVIGIADDTDYLEADINKDYCVNLYDIKILAEQWLECTDPMNFQCKLY